MKKNYLMFYIQVYLFFTLVSYIIIYLSQDSNIIITVLYVILNFSMLAIGFFLSSKTKRCKKQYVYNNKIAFFLILLACISIIISINNILSFYDSISDMIRYISNPGAAYEYVKLKRYRGIQNDYMVNSNRYIGIILNILTFSKYIVLNFTVMYWKKLYLKQKIICGSSIIINLIQAFLIGAMVNIGVYFTSVFPLIIYYIKRNKKMKTNKIFGWIIVFTSGFFLVYFMGTRIVGNNETMVAIIYAGLSGLMFYISHGYVGLSQCLNLPFKFTWGQTMFRGLATIILPKFGVESTFINSYLMRNEIQNGWSALRVWSTIFPWLASDLTFVLIPVVMFCVGKFFKRVWSNAIDGKNPFAFTMTGQLLIFCMMIPSNNQLFHTFGNAIGTIIIYMLYLKSLKRRKRILMK